MSFIYFLMAILVIIVMFGVWVAVMNRKSTTRASDLGLIMRETYSPLKRLILPISAILLGLLWCVQTHKYNQALDRVSVLEAEVILVHKARVAAIAALHKEVGCNLFECTPCQVNAFYEIQDGVCHPELEPKPASVTNSHAGCNYRVCPHPSALELLIDAAIEVESGGDNKAVGDDGKAIGSLQIWRIYFDEAVRVDKKGILRDYRYADCYDRNVAIAVFMIHMRHHAPTELEILKHHVGPWDDTVMTCAEHIYRIHNGGPDGWKQNSTLKNWWKVKALLE